MPNEANFDELTRHIRQLDQRVQILEGLSKTQATALLDKIFVTPARIATALLLDKASDQTDLAERVTKATGKKLGQRAISKHLVYLRGKGLLGRATSGAYYIQSGWMEWGISPFLRLRARKAGLKIEPKRRRVPASGTRRK